MGKLQTQFICNACGAKSPRWQGKCFSCGEWESMSPIEAPKAQAKASLNYSGLDNAEVIDLDSIESSTIKRTSTAFDEFDRVLGGGLVPGSVVLLGGDPGVGKSTLLLQMACLLAHGGAQVLYVTGEESADQVALRAKRLSLPSAGMKLLTSTQLEAVTLALTDHPVSVLVIDSIQTMASTQTQSAPGSVSQVRECALELTRLAKQRGIAVLMIGHMTKDGNVAGPRVLEHMVDTVLYFEGEKTGRYRMLRASKNRFGAVHELGVFAMLEGGLKPVKHPSLLFLSHDQRSVTGSVIMPVWEGTRAFLVELQALADESYGQEPRRVVVGLDAQRVNMLLAILHKHAKIVSSKKDVFINIVGGLKVTEPASDLAMGLAIYSSLANIALPKGLLVMGELGLNGEVRPVQHGQARLQAAVKHGITHVIAPSSNKLTSSEVRICSVSSIQEAKNILHRLSNTQQSVVATETP